jgi:hypothetical protein
VSTRQRISVIGALTLLAGGAQAAEPTKGYPEAVVQWGVQKGETCEDVSKALYGSPKHVLLINRYNHVSCNKGEALPEGLTLVMPEKVGTVPDAKLRSMNPDVRARPPGSGWNPASSGMPLVSNSSVNTLDQGRADVEFVDRTRVFLAPNTLVVIYGTANQTRVSKTPPVAVEVESGEVKAGLAAMRGNVPREAVEVAIKGGGRVSAASRDTVVQRKGERTTVAVFDGKAGVSSGGKSVEVPKNFGTRFVGTEPPAPPRALPPAPVWIKGELGGVALAPGNQGLLSVSWEAIPAATAYRLEVARDEGFNTLLVREEVPASIHAFRAEKMPAGTYHLRVRAIDKEEYLGIASSDRVVRLVEAKIDEGPGEITAHAIHTHPYGALRFTPTSEVEMALDDGPFGPMLDRLDLQKRAPKTMKLRPRGGDPEPIGLDYVKVAASITAAPSDDRQAVEVEVTLAGLEGIDLARQVAPSLRLRLPSGVITTPIKADAVKSGKPFAVRVPVASMPGEARIDVVDGRGAVLGTTTADLSDTRPKPKAKPAPEGPPPRIGVTAPLWQISSATDLIWSAPTAPNAAAVSAGLVQLDGTWATQGQLRGSGSIGALGVDVALRSNATSSQKGDGSAWLGGRYRLLRIGRSDLELAPIVRLGIPTSASSAPTRLEAGVAVGGVAGRFSWLANVGERARLSDDRGASGLPPVQGFLLAGATVDATEWFRAHALIDAHFLHLDAGGNKGYAGFGAGVELGRAVYGGAAVRVSPTTPDGEGVVSAQLSFGVRQVGP